MSQAQKGLQTNTRATISNQIPLHSRLERYINWSGGFPNRSQFPIVIAANGKVQFTHLAANHNVSGSKVAVQYDVGEDCAWILAWDAPAVANPLHPDKVFGVFGTKAVIDAMSWEQVARSLDRAADSISTEAITATIKHDPFTNAAAVVASVRLIM